MLTKSVELVRGEAGFGFSVIGGSDTYLPPMVFTLAPNKAAHSSGQVNSPCTLLLLKLCIIFTSCHSFY